MKQISKIGFYVAGLGLLLAIAGLALNYLPSEMLNFPLEVSLILTSIPVFVIGLYLISTRSKTVLTLAIWTIACEVVGIGILFVAITGTVNTFLGLVSPENPDYLTRSIDMLIFLLLALGFLGIAIVTLLIVATVIALGTWHRSKSQGSG